MPRPRHPRKARLKRRLLPLTVIAAALLAMILRPALAPATVEEQRQRLPPPAHDCDDPVTGIWLGHESLNGRWYRFSLNISRETPGEPELTGTIESYSWDGGPEQSSPPPCDAEWPHREYTIDMPAEGRFADNHISFIGQSWTLRSTVCGAWGGNYYPDGFEGDLIEHGTEFHSLSDDGHNPVVPVVFRRIQCHEAIRAVPELPPPRRAGALERGCGGCF